MIYKNLEAFVGATMKRIYLIQLLESYFPSDSEEIRFKQQILDFVRNNPECFERSLKEGHITASAWVTNKNNSKALLMHHTKLDKWFQLGGHCDGEYDTLKVALKEAHEESGIQTLYAVSKEIFDIDIHLIPENKKEAAHYHYDIRFLLRVRGSGRLNKNNESKELRWITKNPNSLPTQMPSIIRMFNKWINLK